MCRTGNQDDKPSPARRSRAAVCSPPAHTFVAKASTKDHMTSVKRQLSSPDSVMCKSSDVIRDKGNPLSPVKSPDRQRCTPPVARRPSTSTVVGQPVSLTKSKSLEASVNMDREKSCRWPVSQNEGACRRNGTAVATQEALTSHVTSQSNLSTKTHMTSQTYVTAHTHATSHPQPFRSTSRPSGSGTMETSSPMVSVSRAVDTPTDDLVNVTDISDNSNDGIPSKTDQSIPSNLTGPGYFSAINSNGIICKNDVTPSRTIDTKKQVTTPAKLAPSTPQKTKSPAKSTPNQTKPTRTGKYQAESASIPGSVTSDKVYPVKTSYHGNVTSGGKTMAAPGQGVMATCRTNTHVTTGRYHVFRCKIFSTKTYS